MLQPKKSKYRRPQKGRMKKITKRGSEISFGSFALKTLDQYWITARQIEAARQAITREMKRQGKLWIRIFPDRPVTAKGLGVRMGKVRVPPSTTPPASAPAASSSKPTAFRWKSPARL